MRRIFNELMGVLLISIVGPAFVVVMLIGALALRFVWGWRGWRLARLECCVREAWDAADVFAERCDFIRTVEWIEAALAAQAQRDKYAKAHPSLAYLGREVTKC